MNGPKWIDGRTIYRVTSVSVGGHPWSTKEDTDASDRECQRRPSDYVHVGTHREEGVR